MQNVRFHQGKACDNYADVSLLAVYQLKFMSKSMPNICSKKYSNFAFNTPQLLHDWKKKNTHKEDYFLKMQHVWTDMIKRF